MSKNKPIHITYIGRLVPEKGIELVIDCIKKGRETEKNIIWHICWDGAYMSQLRELTKYEKSDIEIYGHIDRQKIDRVLAMTDLVLMPSLFLETFGLVALDTLIRWVPVCGFARGWLTDFVHPALVLDPDRAVDSFFQIIDTGLFPLLDVSDFAWDHWIDRLTELTRWYHRILLVSDYIERVGWAEQYVSDLSIALEHLGKRVDIYGYGGNPTRLTRIWLMYTAPFAFWRGIALSKKIKQYEGDLIWIHGVLRYIWPHGVRSIAQWDGRKYITHHDLALITARPSQVYSERDIAVSPWLGDWVSRSRPSILSIVALTAKWLSVSWIWYHLNSTPITHILPSHWMEPHYRNYTPDDIIVFPHTSQNSNPVKQ